MKIRKQPFVPDRIRRPPKEGFSWIDRRFLRVYVAPLTRDAILLYFFLTAVSDKEGLSYYHDNTIAGLLKIGYGQVLRARDELVRRGLIAYRTPLYQVLSLPVPEPDLPSPRPRGQGPTLICDLLPPRLLPRRPPVDSPGHHDETGT